MPKNKVQTTPVNKDIFIKIVKKTGFSLRKLDQKKIDNSEYLCSERTLRRGLDNNQLRPADLDKIARFLNLDPAYLSGDYYKKSLRYRNRPIDDYVNDCFKYPYYARNYNKIFSTNRYEALSNLLQLFNLSFVQYNELPFNSQMKLQEDLYKSIYKIFSSYFDVDSKRRDGYTTLDEILFYIQDEMDEQPLITICDTEIRQEYIKNPPEGYTSEQFITMPAYKIKQILETPPDDFWTETSLTDPFADMYGKTN